MSSNQNNNPGDTTLVQPLALRSSAVLEQTDEWGLPVVPAAITPASAASTLASYYHALRRHWVVALILGALAAGITFPIVWFAYGPRYECVALIKISMLQDKIVPGLQRGYEPVPGRNEYDVFRSTQQQAIRSRLVLTDALRSPEVLRFELDRRKRDPVSWLQDELKVSFPGDGELMRVSIVRRDPEEAYHLVKAVVDSYERNVVTVDDTRRKQRLTELDDLYRNATETLRAKRTTQKNLAETLGTSDRKGISLKQQVAMEQFSEYQRQLMRTQFELRRAKGELDAHKAVLQAIANMPLTSFELDQYARTDPLYRQIAEELSLRRLDRAYTEANIKPGSKSRYIERFRTDAEMVQAQFEELTRELSEGVRRIKAAEIEREMLKKEAEVASLQEQEVELAREVQRKKEEAERLSASSVDLDMVLTEIENAENVLKVVAEERERLAAERRAPKRIDVFQQPERPTAQSLPGIRIALAIAASLAAMCIPLGVLIVRDRAAQVVSSAEDITRGAGLPVVASVPLVPERVVWRLDNSAPQKDPRQRHLAEAVETVAARVHRKALTDESRVVLVTSAVAGEGKTALAKELALSLARSGRRTVLVDFDLRRPFLNDLFKVPLEPGVSDALRGNNELSSIIRPTDSENLSIFTAGRWDRQAMAALANGATEALFKELRARYEFVVVDSAPVLPVADTRFLSQTVDSVIVTALRDVSQTPKVQEACQILKDFGARSVDVVLIGRSSKDYEL